MKSKKMSPILEMKEGIQGIGIFTTKNIKKGDKLFLLEGKIIDHPTRTSVQVDKNKHVENVIAGCVNHSCTPNAMVQRTEPYAFISLRDIAKGEEVTFDYNANEDKMSCPFICACCGKFIAGKEAVNTSVLENEASKQQTQTYHR